MTPARPSNKWFWIITAANVTVCVLLLLFIYAVLRVLGAFAAGVEMWPLYMLFGVGILLTAASWPLTRSVSAKRTRQFGCALKAGPVLVYSTVLFVSASIWLNTTKSLFLVPAGFQGDLYIVHTDHNRKQSKRYLRTTYRFSNDGVLATPDPEPTLFSDKYAYVYPDGHLQWLHDAGPGTLPDTAENRANTTEVVTYFPRTSTPIGPNACSMEEISIGTRAFLLSRRDERPTPDKAHPGICR